MDAQVKELASLLVHRLDELGRDVTASVRSNVEFYKTNRVVTDEDLLQSSVDNIRFLFASLTAGDPFDTAPAVATGTKRAAAGVPLPGVMAAFRVASHTLWDTMVEVADGRPGITRDAVLQATALIWQAQDVYTDAMADAYRRQAVQMAIDDEAERSALTEALLQSRLSDDRSLWEVAQMLRLPQKGPFVVVAAVCPQIGKQPLPGIAAMLRSVDVVSAWRLLPDIQTGIAHVPSKTEHSSMLELLNRVAIGRIGVSPPFDDLAGTAQGLRYARVAASTHSGGEPGTTVFEDSVLAVAAVSAPEVSTKLARIVLGAFEDLGADEREVLFETFRRWVQNKGSMTTTAEQLYCHPNTVRYRLHRIEERTGRSLSVPNELAELCLAFEIRWNSW
ncbi:PucR family transcriptional regulator [Mycobacterium sp. CBMA247]|nr:PucR family transcriptional regulator [Mycolicibacterium sp. CBMA 329]MUL86005.1 PucR family transcriptional regulator [Mycolicibacterium sp. CBMA 331]MUM28202.1 PucR family transcriptional regulator [Mycolicibacterium sp. CBMA 295]MUM36301.1 PucR family transcriptional regulator [Mycolicibacterium sp. CBMA 247]MUM42069.1 PucR family transcriptional regulator [Mycolicibacterium sp. CBMA 294]